MRRLLIVLLITICSVTCLRAYQQLMGVLGQKGASTPSALWQGIIDPSRAYNWSNAGVRGGIPDASWVQCGPTIQPTGAGIWQPRHAYAVGNQVTDNRGYLFQVVTAGISRSDQPNWSLTPNGLTTDSSITWTMSPGISPTGNAMPDWVSDFPYWQGANFGDFNGNTETASFAGTGGTSTSSSVSRPAFGTVTTVGGQLTEGTVTWQLMQLGGTDSINIINALNTCAGTTPGQVVQLAAGTFYLGVGFTFPTKNVVLRGAGADQTILMMGSFNTTCGNTFICISGSNAGTASYPSGGAAQWISGYSKGSTTIVTTGWQGVAPTPADAGSLIFPDQQSDTIGTCMVSGGLPAGTGICTGLLGFSMAGTTVTVNTDLPHGFVVGQCVGTQGGVAGYTSANNTTASCGDKVRAAWFPITTVPSSNSFTYELPNQSGLAPAQGSLVGDTGGTLINTMLAAVTQSGLTVGRACPGTASAPNPACLPGVRATFEAQEGQTIASVITGGTGSCPAGNTCLVLADPLIMNNWRTQRMPGVWWAGPNQYATHVGMEDFTIDSTQDGQGPLGYSGGIIKLSYAVDSWIKGVRFVRTPRNAVWLLYANHNSIIDNYLASPSATQSTSYGIELESTSAQNLISNNICERGPNCVMTNTAFANVISYNYATNAEFFSGVQRPKINPNHATAAYNLYEGNNSPGLAADAIHGSSNQNTVFRSRIVGKDWPNKAVQQVVSLANHQRAYNFVGNVLGLNNVVDYSVDVWNLGGSNSTGNSLTTMDTLTPNTLLRWGNYDTVTNTTRWCGNSTSPGWTTNCQGVVSASTTATGTATGNVNQICWFNLQGTTGNGAYGYLQLTSTNSIASGTAVHMLFSGAGYITAPTVAQRVSNYAGTGVTPGYIASSCPSTIPITASVAPVSEIPGAFPFLSANPVPTSTSLPASFYLTEQPSFWQMKAPLATPPWPGIGPDITASGSLNTTCTVSAVTGPTSPTGCDGVVNMSYQIPAQICYNNMQPDPAYPVQTMGPITAGYYTTSAPNGVGFALVLTVNNILPTRYTSANNTINLVRSVIITGVDNPAGISPNGYNGVYQVQDANRSQILLIPNGNPGPFVSGAASLIKTVPVRLFNEHNCYANE